MGGSLAPVRVAGFTWNGWQPSAVYADGYLQKTTVFPGQSYSGRFQSQMTRFDQRPESIYALTVELDGERFSFKFIEEADIQTHQRKLF